MSKKRSILINPKSVEDAVAMLIAALESFSANVGTFSETSLKMNGQWYRLMLTKIEEPKP